MSPPTAASSAELDRWYKEEHNEQMSEAPGWIRSSRYKLVVQVKRADSSKSDRPDASEWMTIHEFGPGNKLTTKVEPLHPITDWTKSIMGDMEFIEAFVWEKTGSFRANQ